MIDLGRWAFGNKHLVYFLIAVLVVGGLRAAYDMSKLEDPQIPVKMAMVVAIRPGASAHEMELEVTDPLERRIRAIGAVHRINSWSYNDMALLQVEMKSTTPDGELQQCWDMLRRKVNDAVADLPSGTTLRVQDDFGLVYGMFYALTGDGLSERELNDYARLIQRELTNLDGVARVELYGEHAEAIEVSLAPEKMAMLGILPLEVVTTLKGQNDPYYTGYYESGPQRIRVTVADKFRTVDQIRGMIIQGHEEDQLRLSDIATIRSTYVMPERNSLTYNGEYAIGIAIAGTSGADIVKVGKAVEKHLDVLRGSRLPVGVNYHRVFYQPGRVTDALGTFLKNLIESVLIVIAVLMVAMGFRSGVIIGISLIVTVVGSFLLLGMADGSIQRVSLGAFILAMGMLVDNAIVIIDGILIDQRAGKEHMEALTSIGRRTAMPLLGATLVAILAFLPVFLSPDTAGLYIRDLFIVLAVSLLLSWVLALVHVPLMADHWLKPLKSKAATQPQEPYTGFAYRWLRAVLNFGLRHRIAVLVTSVALVALSLFGARYMRKGFFPDMVYDQLYMEYKLPEGTTHERVAHDLEEIRLYLQTRPEVGAITASMGGTPARYNLVRSIALPSMSYGELIIDFKSPKALDENIEEIQQELNRRYPDAYLKLKHYNIMYKKYPIEVMLTGPDPAVLHTLADSVRSIMAATPEVCLVTTDWEPSVPLLEVQFDQPSARRSGFSRQDISTSLLSAAGGIPVGRFYEGQHEKTIYVKCTEADGRPIDDLESVPLFAMMPNFHAIFDKDNLLKLRTGTIDRTDIINELMQTTPLRQVSDGIKVRWEDPVVPRFNGERAQTVMCSPIASMETEATRKILEKKLSTLDLPTGYTLRWMGEYDASQRTMHYLFLNVPLGIVLMLLILIMLLKDYRKPTIILCSLPLLAVGVVGAMLLTGKSFTFCSIVGTLGLVGMMIKNCIVLMDEIGEQMAAGVAPVEALKASSVSRFRPVIMASLTTILGMIPLLGDAMFGPMAATIMGGLLFSTFATLILLPVLYALFFGIRSEAKPKEEVQE